MNDDYYKNHMCCPKCGNTQLEITCVGYLCEKDENNANCECGWKGIVDDLVEQKYEDTLLDGILKRKEEKEKLEEEEKNRKLAEATHNETDCRKWDIDTTVQYIMWIFQKKTPNEIEEIMNKLIDTIKG